MAAFSHFIYLYDMDLCSVFFFAGIYAPLPTFSFLSFPFFFFQLDTICVIYAGLAMNVILIDDEGGALWTVLSRGVL